MKPRCQGHHDGGAHTSFQCVLDEGHPGFCRPYCAPDVDEWRAAIRLMDDALRFRRLASEWQVDCDAAHDREDKLKVDVARLQAENDALRAIIESGANQSTPTGRDLDAEVVAGVQAGRDDLRGLAGKAST